MILEIIEWQRTATQRKCIVTSSTTEIYRRTALGQSKFSGDMHIKVEGLRHGIGRAEIRQTLLVEGEGRFQTAPACKVPAPVSIIPASFWHHSGLHSHDAF